MLNEKEVLRGFEEGICCAMAVFGELARDIGLKKETAYKIASAFGSGVGYGCTCGCVTGALMAMGYKYGNNEPGQLEKKELIKEKREAFQKEFLKRFGYLNCAEHLHNLNPTVPEDRKIIDEQRLIETVCPPMVCSACELAREFM